MKLIGSGVDIVDIRRIQKIYTKYTQSFAKKILHEVELVEFNRQRNKPQYLSNRFAVKEAIAKAFGTGMRGEMLWKNIYITHDKLGKPIANFENNLANQIGANELEVSISISHEKNYTIAHAIAFNKKIDK